MHLMAEDADIDPLATHQQDSISLLNSRHRMDCEPSQRTSRYDQEEAEEHMREFQIEIEERFKLSIANKIYTFPRIIRCVEDVISSSSEDETEESSELLESMGKYNKETAKDMLKIKGQELVRGNKGSDSKATKADYRDSALKTEKARFEGDKIVLHTSKSIGKIKVKIKNSSKKKEQNQSKQKLSLKKVGSTDLKGAKKRNERIKTELQPSPSNVLETIRSKMRKN